MVHLPDFVEDLCLYGYVSAKNLNSMNALLTKAKTFTKSISSTNQRHRNLYTRSTVNTKKSKNNNMNHNLKQQDKVQFLPTLYKDTVNVDNEEYRVLLAGG